MAKVTHHNSLNDGTSVNPIEFTTTNSMKAATTRVDPLKGNTFLAEEKKLRKLLHRSREGSQPVKYIYTHAYADGV
ncbi:unnamed protein product [Victoria cruziana]